MAKLPEVVPISDFRQDAAAILERVKESRDPLIITQRGRAAAVMLSVEAYASVEHERRLLQALLRGERDIARGGGHDLEAVLRDADALLETD